MRILKIATVFFVGAMVLFAQTSTKVKNITVSGTLVVSNSGLYQEYQLNIPNDTSTGTTANRVAKLSGNSALNATTSDTATVVYCIGPSVVVDGTTFAAAGKNGNAPLVLHGQCTLTFDSNGGTINHYVGVSTIAAANSGIVMDLGTSVPVGTYCVGQLQTTVLANGTGTVQLGNCNPAASAGYSRVQNNGTNVAQETKLNFLSGLTCADNAGVSTDCSQAVVALPNGSISAPSFYNASDPNGIGFYRDTSGWKIEYGGANHFRWVGGGFELVEALSCFYWATDGTFGTTNATVSATTGGVVLIGNGANCSNNAGTLQLGVLQLNTDAGLSRDAAATIDVGGGAQGDKSGQLNLTTIQLQATHFASLGTPANGTIKYCDDCTVASPCAGSGGGAIAKRLGSVWVCN